MSTVIRGGINATFRVLMAGVHLTDNPALNEPVADLL